MSTQRVTICGPNLRDQSKGTFHVHAEGCADLVRHARREPEYRYGWTIEASSQAEVGDEIYADHIAEGSMQPGEGADDCHFFPCVTLPTYGTIEPGQTDPNIDDYEMGV